MRARKLSVDHLAFPSFDAHDTYHFYTEILGFRLTSAFTGKSSEWGNKRYMITMYSFGQGEIHFFDVEGLKRPKPDGLPKDIRHIALAVASRAAVAQWQKRLKAHGVSYWVEDHDGSPSVYFSDPNGVMIEINCHRREPFDKHAAAAGQRIVQRWTATPRASGRGR